MGNKLVWVGMTLLLAVPALGGFSGAELAGALILALGTVLVCLDR